MKIDLDNLNQTENSLLNEIAESIKQDFNAVVGQLYKSNKNKLSILFSGIASRNPYFSPLFLRCCKISLVLQIIKNNPEIKITVCSKDYGLVQCLRKHFSVKNKTSVIVCYNGLKIKFLISCIKPIYYLFKNYIHLVKRFIAKKKLSENKSFNHCPTAIIDIFVLSGDKGGGRIENNKYNDRYYPGLRERLERKGIAVRYISTLISAHDIKKTFAKLRSCNTPFYIQEDYLNIIDFCKIAVFPFKILTNKIVDCRFRGVEIDNMLRLENFHNFALWSSFQALINYYFARRIADEKPNIKFLLDWNENQIIDRGLILGFKKFLPDVRVIGYQGFIISHSYHIYLTPTKFEYDNGVTPHVFAVTGKALVQSLKESVEDLSVVHAPAFRFSNVWRPRQGQPSNQTKTILVGLPINEDEKIWICNLVNETAKNFLSHNLEFVIKPHPNHENIDDLNKLKNQFEKPNIKIKTGDVHLLIDRSHVFLGSSSSTCVEALVKGLFTIILGNNNGLIQNPIPKTLCKKRWRVCFNATEITNELKHILNGSDQPKEVDLVEMRKACFNPATDESIDNFINYCCSDHNINFPEWSFNRTGNNFDFEEAEYINFLRSLAKKEILFDFINFYILKAKVKLLKKVFSKKYTHPSLIFDLVRKVSTLPIPKPTPSNNLFNIESESNLKLANFEFVWSSKKDWFVKFEDPEDELRLHRWNWLLDDTDPSSQRKSTLKFLVQDWCANCNITYTGRKKDYYTVGERIANIAIFNHLIDSTTLTCPVILHHLSSMCFHLSQNLEYHGSNQTNNHSLNNGRALYLGGIVTNNNQITNLGSCVIKESVTRLISKDGFLVEGSTHYHILVTRWMLECLWFAILSKDIEFQNYLKKICDQLLQKCTFFTGLENNKTISIPLIGDVSPDFSPEWLNNLTQCDLVNRNVKVNKKKSGWISLWNGQNTIFDFLPNVDFTKNGSYLYPESNWFRLNHEDWVCFWHLNGSGTANESHSHSDACSFVLYWKGKEVIVDPGRYSYMFKESLDVYGISPSSSNSLLIDNLAPMVNPRAAVGRFPNKYKAFNSDIQFYDKADCYKVTIDHSGFDRIIGKKVKHRRDFIFTKNTVTINDSIDCDSPVDTVRFLHLHPRYSLSQAGKRFLVNQHMDDHVFSININEKNSVYRHALKGVLGSKPIGWFFDSYGKKTPSYTLCLKDYLNEQQNLFIDIKVNEKQFYS